MDIQQIYDQSYVPYSGCPEAAVVLSSEGRYFPGVRIENISYPLTISAAQNALFCCLSEGDYPQKLMVSQPNDPLLSFWKKEYSLAVQILDPDKAAYIDFFDILHDSAVSPMEVLVPLLDRAQVKESNFPVAALLKTKAGYVGGVNIECTSWTMGLCAERVAISKALSYGLTGIGELHVHTRYGEFSSPCGACRQVMNEHLPGRKVYLHHADCSQSVHFSNDLLPYNFQSSSLHKS